MKYALILFVVAFLSCSEDDSTAVDISDLRGKWVEIETRTDTLSFELVSDSEIMSLNRGTEIRNGNLLPKYNSGPYTYKLGEEKISLYWTLSSNSSFNDYYFSVKDNRLQIGNFYNSESGETLTFEKLP
jgi:hypothetical protein